MNTKFANSSRYSFEEVMEAKTTGGRFVTYQWFLPLPLFSPVRRLSKIYFIPSKKSASAHARRFNLVSLIIGWWGLPWGPIYVFRSLKLNNSGGVDVTEDVYLNIDKRNYEAGKIQITSTTTTYTHPSPSEIKEFKKVFKKLLKDGVIQNPPLIGIDMNTEDNEKPFFLIGFDQSIDEIEQTITAAIYQRFYKHTRFELIVLNDDFEARDIFISQAVRIECE